MVSVLEEPLGPSLFDFKETKNSLQNNTVNFFLEGAPSFAREAILCIAQQAVEVKTGARALRSIMETIMLDAMYDLPTIEGSGSCN